LIADPKTKLVLSFEQTEGCVHDFRLYKDRTGSAVSPNVPIKTDSGCLGIAAYHANSEVPYKKSKNHPLTEVEKAFNHRLARERIVIEHINREIKLFKIMAERYRNRRRRHKLRMTRICAIRNYEIINKSD